MKILSLLFVVLVSICEISAGDPITEDVFSALVNLTHGQNLSSLILSEEAKASLHSISNINIFEQREKPQVWPYWSLSCSACEAAAALIIGLFDIGTPLPEIEEAVINLCISLDIEAPEVCEGAVHSFGYQLEYILKQGGDSVTPALFCGVFVGGDCGDQGEINDWNVELPGDKPQPANVDSPVEDGKVLRVLQLADVHIDLTYTPGTNVNCGLPCCCMAGTGVAEDEDAAAGFWGDYQCDIPLRTLEAMLSQVSESLELDYIIYTGDSPAHDVWIQSKDRNLENEVTVLNLLQSYFPQTPIYLSMGNHEGFPVNMFPTAEAQGTNVSVEWLYDNVADMEWANSLNIEDRDMFRQNGFYTTLLQPGLRLVSLNTNFCHGENFFMFLDFSDPAEQLSWLIQVLLKSELEGEKVHILGHHPLKSCLPGWEREYGKVINRFQDTVTAQFHGHTHDDWFIVYHNDTGHPSTTAFIAPSGTSYTNRNPEFRIYSVVGDQEESSYGYILDHETWTMDLSLTTSEDDTPVWSPLYSARSDLGLAGVTAGHWKDILDQANGDTELFEKLVVYFNQNHWNGELPAKSSFLCNDVWNIDCPYTE